MTAATLVPSSPAPRSQTVLLLAGAVLLLPLLAYFGTAASIVQIWQRSDTFAHGYAILPLSLWLIWQRRAVLRNLPIQPYWPAVAALALCGLAWLLAELGEVQFVRQYAFGAMLPLTALAILGLPMARAMAFPLLFILFAVPFGEVFIEPLIGVTANFTVWALQMTGIPVFREGNNFSLPSGNWSVVEACSGVRYLISSVTLGCLYAYLTYRSTLRRGVFIVFSILVPIAANGLRAYMIVMMGHLSGMTMAVGVDHLIYGWVFFGIVMFVLFSVGSLWREDHTAPDGAAEQPAAVRPASAPPARMALAALVIGACLFTWPAYLAYLDRAPLGAMASAPVLDFTPRWQAAATGPAWRPAYPRAAAELHRSYLQGGQAVDLSVLYYRLPPKGTKLISSTNRLADFETWRQLGETRPRFQLGARSLQVREAVLTGPNGKRLVWHWYEIDGSAVVSDVAGKLLQVRQKLVGNGSDGAAVMLSAHFDEDPEQARKALRAFALENLSTLEASLAANRRP